MFQFLQPIWFSALAGITIPVIIHLWNQRPGKTLKVGSVSLVNESLRQYQNRIRLSEIWLLILRCLLITFIALALASPVWRSANGKNTKGWLLMSRPERTALYYQFRPVIDSLLSAGYELHSFEPGFEKTTLQEALADTAGNVNPGISYRELVAELNQRIDATTPVYVFTDAYLHHFYGKRTAVAMNLHWQLYQTDSVAAIPAKETAPLQITVFSKHYLEDAHYLLAALEAIRQFAKQDIRVQFAQQPRDIAAQQDWLFCLEDTLPGNSFSAGNILKYESGSSKQLNTSILPAGEHLFAPVQLNRLTMDSNAAGQLRRVDWQDGFGHAVLTSQATANAVHYALYTHFNPGWNDLPWSGNFPAILYGLLYAKQSAGRDNATDKLLIDHAQAMPPLELYLGNTAKPGLFKITGLANICWLLVFMIFFAERGLSFYHAKTKANG